MLVARLAVVLGIHPAVDLVRVNLEVERQKIVEVVQVQMCPENQGVMIVPSHMEVKVLHHANPAVGLDVQVVALNTVTDLKVEHHKIEVGVDLIILVRIVQAQQHLLIGLEVAQMRLGNHRGRVVAQQYLLIHLEVARMRPGKVHLQ